MEEMIEFKKEEAKYCIQICGLVEKYTNGSDIKEKIKALRNQLETETGRPTCTCIQISQEQKNILSKTMTIYELLVREKNDVLKNKFGVYGAQANREEIANFKRDIDNSGVDIAALRAKLRTKQQKKEAARKLYIADQHFYHNNLNSRMDKRGFSGFEEMNRYMIKQWNDHVTQKDEVYILGDISIARGKPTNEILAQLNGKKYLVEGNHDKFLGDRDFDRSLFEWIKPYAEIHDNKRNVILSHYPVFCYKGQYRTTPEGNPITYMLYGHVHDTHDEKLVNEFIRMTRATKVLAARQKREYPIPCNMINCFCMFSDYVPLTLDEWIRLDADRRLRMAASHADIITGQ